MKSCLAIPLSMLLCCCGHHSFHSGQDVTDHPLLAEEIPVDERFLQPGNYAPPIAVPYLYNHSPRESLSRSLKRPHVVLFWASWCPDCRAICDSIKWVQGKYSDVEWITVSLDNTALEAKRYLEAHKISGTHLFDGRAWKSDVCKDHAVHVHGIPYMYLVDSCMTIRWRGSTLDDLDHILHQGL